MKIELPASDLRVAKSLSAIARAGNDLWIGGDEGVEIVCTRLDPASGNFKYAFQRENLVSAFQLPSEEGKEDSEVDLEAMDFDGRYLWLIGSHSGKRKEADHNLDDSENLKRLKTVTRDPHRFLLGRLPLIVDAKGNSSVLAPGSYRADHFPARLECDLSSSELSEVLGEDSLLKTFLNADIPSKDNGLDIEGLAWDGTHQRLFVGLRAPVLRGIAVILELQFDASFGGKDQAGVLSLKPIGPKDRKYRRHFLALGGLSVRDLCFDGDDLLVLAGPALPIPWPPTIFRWIGAGNTSTSGNERFYWQEKGHLLLLEPQEMPADPKAGNAEGITLWGSDRLLIVRDSIVEGGYLKFPEPGRLEIRLDAVPWPP